MENKNALNKHLNCCRIAYALTEVRKYLIPDSNDEIRQEQMREMEIIRNQIYPILYFTNTFACFIYKTFSIAYKLFEL